MIYIPFVKVNIKEETIKQCENDPEFKKEWELLQNAKKHMAMCEVCGVRYNEDNLRFQDGQCMCIDCWDRC